jgi:hypothetical protein
LRALRGGGEVGASAVAHALLSDAEGDREMVIFGGPSVDALHKHPAEVRRLPIDRNEVLTGSIEAL